MIFFTVLFGACVAIQSGVLKPVVHQKSVVSLIHTAKSDPHALIQMLEGADKETLKTILALLNDLRVEAMAEQARLTTLVAKATGELALGTKELKRLEGILIIKKTNLDAATKAFNTADGRWQQTKADHDAGAPRLNQEITVFTKVLVILRNMLNGQPQSKDLLELGDSAQGQVYQKMIENIKADPGKLKKVIAIVAKLLTQSKAELKSLKDTMDAAKGVRDAAFKVLVQARAEHTVAAAAVSAQKTVVQTLTGALQEAKREYDANYKVVTKERGTLEDVIKILNDMLKAQG